MVEGLGPRYQVTMLETANVMHILIIKIHAPARNKTKSAGIVGGSMLVARFIALTSISLIPALLRSRAVAERVNKVK